MNREILTSLRLLYSKFKINLYSRPLNIGPQEDEDDAPVNLGSSCVDFRQPGPFNTPNGQRQLLQTCNVLRPRAFTRDNKNYDAKQIRDGQFESEFGKNYQDMAPAGGAYTQYREIYANPLPDGIQTYDRPQDWIHGRQPHTNGELSGDGDLVDFVGQSCRAPDTSSAVTFEGKAANAADRFLDMARHQNGLSTVRDDHLDGPVFSNITSEEVEVGQFVGHFHTSDEFECDGNNYTSLTDSSMD